jgi:hypothetical protein
MDAFETAREPFVFDIYLCVAHFFLGVWQRGHFLAPPSLRCHHACPHFLHFTTLYTV